MNLPWPATALGNEDICDERGARTHACSVHTLQKRTRRLLGSKDVSSRWKRLRNESEAVLGSFFLKKFDLLFPISGVVMLGALVDVFLAVLKHSIHESRKLGAHGRNRLRRSQSGAQATKLCAEVTFAFAERSRRHAKRGGQARDHSSRLFLQDLPSTDIIAGRKPDPGNEIDRKSTRLNSSHTVISYAVFCLKKK